MRVNKSAGGGFVKSVVRRLSLMFGSWADYWPDFGGNSEWSGKSVTVDGALQLSTVWACVRLISETIATLPLGFYERRPDGSRAPATNHELYNILHNQPNADMTAVVFWEAVIASLLLWGNAFVEIRRNKVGGIAALDFISPDQVTVRRLDSGDIAYLCQDNPGREPRRIPEANMMHIRGFGVGGLLGLSPISYGANVFGTAMAADEAGATTFKNGMRSPGIVTVDRSMTPEQRNQLRSHVRQVADDGGFMVLEKGADFKPLTFNPHDAELLASRSFNIEEICRWFRVDPSIVGHGAKDSNWGTGLEQKMIWLLTFCLQPWCIRVEQAVKRSLLTPVERLRYFSKFSFEGLLRADSAARASYYSIMEQNGNMTRDEIRAFENLPPMGGNAAVLTVQSNMIPLDKLGEQTSAVSAQDALKSWLKEDAA